MNNLEDFLQWWEGFRAGVDPANITKEHLDIIDRKINGLQSLWDVSFPAEEQIGDGYLPGQVVPWPTMQPYGWPYLPVPQVEPTWPKVPTIWCNGVKPHIGTPQNPPRVGTPLYN